MYAAEDDGVPARAKLRGEFVSARRRAGDRGDADESFVGWAIGGMHKFGGWLDEGQASRHCAERMRDRKRRHIGESREQKLPDAKREKHVRRRRRNALIAVWMAIEIEKWSEDPY